MRLDDERARLVALVRWGEWPRIADDATNQIDLSALTALDKSAVPSTAFPLRISVYFIVSFEQSQYGQVAVRDNDKLNNIQFAIPLSAYSPFQRLTTI